MASNAQSRRESASRLNGIYVIVGHSGATGQSPFDISRAAIDGGACAIQLRDKLAPRDAVVAVAYELREICADANVLFIVNDDPALAAEVDADGVHVGQSDASVGECRTAMDPHQFVGRSNATLEEARESMAMGADYVAVGAMFPSGTKLDTRPAGLEVLRSVVEVADVPTVAIGGVTVDNVAEVAATGVDAVCVASAVTDANDPLRATANLLRAFESGKP